MKYIYHINGEKREPTPKEWSQLADVFLTMAGLQKNEIEEKGGKQ